jgi:hypothetical protein
VPDDTLSAFAWALSAKIALAKANHEEPEEALLAIGLIMHEAKQDPEAWLARNRLQAAHVGWPNRKPATDEETDPKHAPAPKPPAQPARAKMPKPEDVYRYRREQVEQQR